MVVVSMVTDPVRRDLKTVPGGYVVLRPMSYGEKQRRSELSIQDTRMQRVSGRGKGSQEIAMQLMQRIVSEFEFATCIVEHNLEMREGAPYNFLDPKSLDYLPGQVGEEIDTYISEMNNFLQDEDDEDEDPEGNSSIS